MKISIIIISWNTKNILSDCLKSLEREDVEEIIVVDNASTDGSPEMVKKKFPNAILIENPCNYGFARAVNIGIKATKSKVIFILNSDIIIKLNTISKIKYYMTLNRHIGIASPVLISPCGERIQNIRVIPSPLYIFLYCFFILKVFPVLGRFLPNYIQGAAFVLRKSIIQKVGLLDENFFFYGEDADFCLRVKKSGFSTGIISDAEVIHLEGGSSKKKSANYYFVKNWEAKFKIIEKYYSKRSLNITKQVVRFHFLLRKIFNSISSISDVNRERIINKIATYIKVSELCRK